MWENGSVREVYLRDNDRLAVDLGEERRGVADGGHTPEVIVELGGRLTRQRKLGGEILAQLERAAALGEIGLLGERLESLERGDLLERPLRLLDPLLLLHELRQLWQLRQLYLEALSVGHELEELIRLGATRERRLGSSEPRVDAVHLIE